jgi:MFS family permease
MLTQTAGQPLYGKISDLIGRKVRVFSDQEFLRLMSV